MSEIFKIFSNIKTYTVTIQASSSSSLISEYSGVTIIDKNVYKLWPNLGIVSPLIVDAIESNKVMSTVANLVEGFRQKGMTREDVLLSIGGGIIQDVSTFSASCYMRGVKWVYVPTTLLGMVDSCIGGKSSINVGKYKNIAGNYFPPEKIVIDTDFCKTLTTQQLVDGLCESVKICYAHSKETFTHYIDAINFKGSLLDLDFEKVVVLSLKTKKIFIEEDEFDNGIRLLLNFGHTFGHALEGASHFKISHGIAVGLGMFAAFRLSVLMGLVDVNCVIVQKLLRHVGYLLQHVEGLKDVLNQIEMNEALDNFKSDKKHSKGHYIAILYNKEGGLIRHEFLISKESEDLILLAFESIKEYEYEI